MPDEPTPTPTPAPSPTPVNPAVPTPTPAPTPQPPKPAAAEFEPIASQADLDRIINTRLAREREKFADYADLKKKAAEHDKAVEAAKSEQEKAVEAARKEGETAAQTRANDRLKLAEARALAAEAKFAAPAVAARALDLADVKVSDDGTVDADAIKAKLKELADSGAFVIGDGKKPDPKPDAAQGGGPKGGVNPDASARELLRAGYQ